MGLQREFAEILQEKLGNPVRKTTAKVTFQSQNSDFPSWKYQFTAQQKTFTPQQIPQIYPRPVIKKKAKTPPIAKVIVQEPVYKIGELGLEYTSDLIALQSLGADLDPAQISLSKLKKEYRKLAMKWHPDRSSSANSGKNFQSACKAYRNLSKALSNLSE